MEAIMKETFRDLALKMRYDRGLTQQKMAEVLVMSTRSYEDIEYCETELLLQRYDSVSFLLEIANNKILIKNHNNDTN